MAGKAIGPRRGLVRDRRGRRRRNATGSGRCGTIVADIEARDEFIRRSLWRVRTTTRRRAFAAAITFLIVTVVGLAMMWGTIALLRALSAPQWLVAMPWLAPTAGMLYWTIARPSPAVLSDDDDDSWVGYSMRLVLFGADVPQALPIRLVAALLLGAPVVWSFIVFTLLELVGIF